MQEKAYWLGWQMILPGMAKRIWNLVERFGSVAEAWKATANDLVKTGGCSPETAAAWEKRKIDLDLDIELARLEKAGVNYVTYKDSLYPELLRTIFDPPPGIFVRGSLKNDNPAVAIVGSRKPTPYGLAVAEQMAEEVARAGVTVVSGMARGIDSGAHRGALKAGGLTFAVLGCGLDVVYPKENRRLMEDIASSGAVISEFPLGSLPEAWHFPVRNRIISGLSSAILIVEAGERSGALITADCALEQGRDVMAVPGSISSSLSKGPNRLIKQGARLVEKAEDILEEIGVGLLFKTEARKAPPFPRLTGGEEQIYRLLSHDPINLEELISVTGLPAQEVLAAIMFLEIKGLVRQLPGRLYVLRGLI